MKCKLSTLFHIFLLLGLKSNCEMISVKVKRVATEQLNWGNARKAVSVGENISFPLSLEKARDNISFSRHLDSKRFKDAIHNNHLSVNQNKEVAVSLTKFQDILYTGTLFVGSNSQPFQVIYDTGSADVWIPHAQCKICSGKKTFSRNESKTFASLQRPFSIQYGSGKVEGTLSSDMVGVTPAFSIRTTFGEVTNPTNLGGIFLHTPIEGVVGLGFRSLSVTKTVPWWMELYEKGKIDIPMFAFHVSPSGEDVEITFGGWRRELAAANPIWLDVVRKDFWTINFSSLDSIFFPFVNHAIVDTGTTHVKVPQLIFSKIAFRWGLIKSANGSFFTDCSNKKIPSSIEIVLGGYVFAIPKISFLKEEDASIGSDSAKLCSVLISPMPHGIEVVVLGDAFLKNFITVFDGLHSKVGFARSREEVMKATLRGKAGRN